MISIQAVLLVLLLSIKYQSVQNQCWNGYGIGSTWDSYAQSYNPYGGYPPYDYRSASTICITTYPQPNPYDYYQQPCQQPVVVVINGNDYHNNCGCRSDFGYSDCGCGGCGCSYSASCCDCGCNCGCSECEKWHSKSKYGCDCGCGCSNSDCGCNKCIKHKNDRCCRGY